MTATGTTATAGFYEGPIETIWFNPDLRGTIGRLEGLTGDELQRFADRIEEHGQYKEVDVWPLPEGHPQRALGYEYSLIAGANRYTAIALKNEQRKEQGKEPLLIKFKVHPEITNEEQAFLWTVRENEDRQDTGYIDDALNMAHMRDVLKWSASQVAKEYGITDASVSQHLSVLKKIPAKYWPYINREEIKISAALQAMQLSSQEKLTEAMEAYVKLIEAARSAGEKPISGQQQIEILRQVAARGTQGQVSNGGSSTGTQTPANGSAEEKESSGEPAPVRVSQSQTPAAPPPPPPAIARQRSMLESKQMIESLRVLDKEGNPDLSDPMTKYHQTLLLFIAGQADAEVVRNVAFDSFLSSYDGKEEPKAKPVAKPTPGVPAAASKKSGKPKAAKAA
jgi:predicted transcriptional regulator